MRANWLEVPFLTRIILFLYSKHSNMRLFLLVLVMALAVSCDDGDVTVTAFNFDNASIQFCENVVYKTNKNELLYLNIPADSFKNQVTPVDEPIKVNLGTSNSVGYRLYALDVTSNDFCGTITPTTAIVMNEWMALAGVENESGYVQIITTETKDETTGVVTGYEHEIRLINMTFTNGTGQFIFDNYLVGVHTTTI